MMTHRDYRALPGLILLAALLIVLATPAAQASSLCPF